MEEIQGDIDGSRDGGLYDGRTGTGNLLVQGTGGEDSSIGGREGDGI